jgi:hypothetical protein
MTRHDAAEFVGRIEGRTAPFVPAIFAGLRPPVLEFGNNIHYVDVNVKNRLRRTL